MQIVDFHSHLMPAVDDGAQTEAEVRSALREFEQAGVTACITTPHLNGSLTRSREALAERLNELDHGWQALQQIAADHSIRIFRGTEVMLDTPEPDLSDPRVRLNGSRFVLIEFPFMSIPPRSVEVIQQLRVRGWCPIIAHPERYQGIQADIEIARRWKEAGAFLQSNGPSLLGKYGGTAQSVATTLIQRGWIDYLSSDYHARGSPGITAYRAWLEEAGAGEQGRLLTETNPARLLKDQPPLPMAPWQPKRGGLLNTIGRWLKR